MGHHFVLVHGACQGAWSWFKLVDRLEKAGHKVTALDMASAGIHTASPDTITTYSEYHKPVFDFLASLPQDEKVVLIGHSMGGIGTTQAMERFSHKIGLGIFLSAIVLRSGVIFLEDKPYNEATGTDTPIIKAVQYIFGNGPDNPPTSWILPKATTADIFYNGCSSEDVALANMLLKPFPITMLTTDCITYTKEKHGQVPSVYIKCLQDRTWLPQSQNHSFEVNGQFEEVVEIDTDHFPQLSDVDNFMHLTLRLADKYTKMY